MTPNFHQHLLACMKKFGLTANDEGVCLGFGVMAMQAILAPDTATFDKRRRAIGSHTPDELYARVEETKRSIVARANKTPTTKEYFLLEIAAFLEDVELAQFPERYPDWFYRDVSSDVKDKFFGRQFPLLFSQALEAQKKEGVRKTPKGWASIDTFSGVYDRNELMACLLEFRDIIRQNSFFEPIGFTLRDHSHLITIGYHPSINQWFFIDSNQEVFSGLDNTLIEETQIVNSIFKAFDQQTEKSVLFETGICVALKNQHLLQPLIMMWHNQPNWQAAHRLTDQKAQFKSLHGTTWLYTAARMGDAKLVKDLLERADIVAPNQADKNGLTALHAAARLGHIEVVRVLLEQKGINPNPANQSGLTPLHFAAAFGHTEVVSVLLERAEAPNPADKDGLTPLHQLFNFLSFPQDNKTFLSLFDVMNLESKIYNLLNFEDKATTLFGFYKPLIDQLVLLSNYRVNLFDKMIQYEAFEKIPMKTEKDGYLTYLAFNGR